jgi:hypothetical protein
MTTCIYCHKVGKSFPKEHVVPRAFGHFRDNLTLDCVCRDCNAFFSRELELFLTRDSAEALLRVRYGLNVKGGRQRLGKSKLIIRVISPGDWYGARLAAERIDTGNAITAEPLPQVAFRKHGETEWTWFLEEELDERERWERYRTDADTKIVGKPDAVVQRIIDKMARLGIKFKQMGTFEKHGGMVEVFAEAMLDDIIFRGIAKIAVNFLAYLKSAEFVLRPEFNGVREYVRFGKKAPMPFVIASNFPILRGDNARYRQTNGHIVVLDWDRMQKGIVCMVSLFNHLTYHARLCEHYSGLWHRIEDGRHFDWQSGTISRVQSSGLVVSDSLAGKSCV